MVDIGTLGGTDAYAYGINSSGVVVGGSDTAGDQSSGAFVYFNGIMLGINSMLDSESSGYNILCAYGINDAGDIAAIGTTPTSDGNWHAMLITPVATKSAH